MSILTFKKNKKNQKGFTLLFAVILSVLVLAVGASIISISLKQIILSGSARESQFAFYAANTGIECAFYWDLKRDLNGERVFLASTTAGLSFDNSEVECMGKQLLYNPSDMNKICNGGINDINKSYNGEWCVDVDSDSSPTFEVPATKFRITFADGSSGLPYCADVIVKKHLRDDFTVGTTTVESRGYNTCDSNSPRRVERGLTLTY